MMVAMVTPFGRTPVRNSFLMSAALHVPMPVSLSWVMLGAVTLNGGSSNSRNPEKALSMMSPVGPFGVWQLPQVSRPLTR
jgi:hypothetical protein